MHADPQDQKQNLHGYCPIRANTNFGNQISNKDTHVHIYIYICICTYMYIYIYTSIYSCKIWIGAGPQQQIHKLEQVPTHSYSCKVLLWIEHEQTYKMDTYLATATSVEFGWVTNRHQPIQNLDEHWFIVLNNGFRHLTITAYTKVGWRLTQGSNSMELTWTLTCNNEHMIGMGPDPEQQT